MPKVHIRKKALTKGRHSIYLDFSPPLRNPKNGKPQRFEFLDLFTYDKPSNVWERQHNYAPTDHNSSIINPLRNDGKVAAEDSLTELS